MTDYGAATEAAIKRVVTACERYGSDSIIGLAGVPGTGKSYIAAIAAQRYTVSLCLFDRSSSIVRTPTRSSSKVCGWTKGRGRSRKRRLLDWNRQRPCSIPTTATSC